MKHYVAMSNFSMLMNPEKILQWALDKNYDGIEIWFDVPYFHVDEIDKKMIKMYAEKQNRIKYTAHAPIYGINISCVNPGIRKESIRQIKKTARWCRELGIKSIAVHPGKAPVAEKRVIDEVKKITYNSLKEIKESMAVENIEILIENIAIAEQDIDRDIRYFKRLIEKLDVGICYDTGHANINWRNEKIQELFGNRIKRVHVSDNRGYKDEHLSAGEGNVQWDRCRFLSKGELPMVHEVRSGKKTKGSNIKSREALEKLFHVKQSG